MFEALNTTFRNTVREGIETKDLEYVALKELIGSVVSVDGYFFNDKGKYGRQVVVVGHPVTGARAGELMLINMPSRYVEQFEIIDKDEKMLSSVLNGGLTLTDIEIVESKNGTTTACRFVG